MLLENVYVAAGPVPKGTGDPVQDYRELQAFAERLLRVLERNFDVLQEKVEGKNHG